MTKIDKKTVKKVADLAKIDLTNEEINTYTKQLSAILEYVSKIDEIDTQEVEEFKTQVDIEAELRQDVPESGISQKEAISQARKSGGYVAVPAVI